MASVDHASNPDFQKSQLYPDGQTRDDWMRFFVSYAQVKARSTCTCPEPSEQNHDQIESVANLN